VVSALGINPGRITSQQEGTDYFLFADKQPRIARADIDRGIIAQFYASDFWTRLGHYEVFSILDAEGMGDPGGNVIGHYQHPA
jgi:hypothetical protein